MSADTMGRAGTGSGARVRQHNRMAPVLAGVGALLFVLGALVHFYAVPKLAVAPVDLDSITNLEATDATIFDTGTLKPLTTDLAVTNRTVGNVQAAKKAPAHTVVWASMTTIRSVPDNVVRSQSTSSAAVDDKTSMAVDCCGNFTEDSEGVRTPTKPAGLLYKFPFGTQKKTYQVWDSTLGQAVPAHYTGTTSIHGMKVYSFVYEVPATKVGDDSLPRSVFGLKGDGNVKADSMYQTTVTQWIEPTTGAVINNVQDVKTWYAADGSDLVTTAAKIHYTDAQVSKMVHDYKGQATMLRLASGVVPWLVMLVGLVAAGVGFVTGRRRA